MLKGLLLTEFYSGATRLSGRFFSEGLLLRRSHILYRSRDNGETWEDAALPGQVNSTIWSIATNPADPNLIFLCTIFGQIFRSTDGGENWLKMERELGELREIVWQPTPGA